MAHRGPLASTRVPNNAAERPSMMMPSSNGSAVRTPAFGLFASIVAASGVLNTLQA
jgi:hypothetical protein